MSPNSNESALAQFCDLKDCRALDVGCGTGDLLRFMRSQGAHVTGAECNPAQRSAAMAESGMGGIEIVDAVGQDLPFPDEGFDLVVFMFSLHHVPVDSQGDALREAARVLAPGGMLYVAEPLCEGSGFEVHAPVDDETEVRAAALQALGDVAASALTAVGETQYTMSYHYKAFADYKDDMVRIDPSRRDAFEAMEDDLRGLFETLGVLEPEGMRFDQPVRVNMYRKD